MPRGYGGAEILGVGIDETTTDRSGKDGQGSDRRECSEKGEASSQANHGDDPDVDICVGKKVA